MFDSGYKFRYVNRSVEKEGVDNVPLVVHIYSFRCDKGKCYIVRVEEYPDNFFAIKFFAKQHKNSRQKYSLITRENKATRIIRTCVDIMVQIHKANPYVSFGFVGAQSEGEGIANTKRFRIYRRLFENIFAAPAFQHYAMAEQSWYLIVNMDLLEEQASRLQRTIVRVWNQFSANNKEGYSPI